MRSKQAIACLWQPILNTVSKISPAASGHGSFSGGEKVGRRVRLDQGRLEGLSNSYYPGALHGPRDGAAGKQNIGSTRYRGIQSQRMNKRNINSVMLLLLISMMTNAFGWAFNGEVFAHELDHEHHLLSLDPTAHLGAHQHAAINDEGHMDAATHLCLHAAGQYQPFFFIPPPFVPATTGVEPLIAFLPVIVPESIPDSPLHPPKKSS